MKAALRGHDYATQVQMLAPDRGAGKGETGADVHAAAAEGVRSGGGRLPYGEQIQRSFGGYDISNVVAHTGAAAEHAASAMGASAYATGNDVVLGKGGTDLHTVAHEAAHVVQQRAGVSLSGGVGHAGDPYERHADAVADLVVQGKSAEGLLGQMAGGGGGGGVQMKGGDPSTDAVADSRLDPMSTNLDRDADDAHDGMEICKTSAEGIVNLVTLLRGSAGRFGLYANAARKSFEEAARHQARQASGQARMASAVRDANDSARRRALMDMFMNFPDIMNTLVNIRTIGAASKALSAGVASNAALAATRAPAFGAGAAKALGNAARVPGLAERAVTTGHADATIGAVASVSNEVSRIRGENALEAEVDGYSSLEDAFVEQGEAVRYLLELSCLGVDNIPAFFRKTFDHSVDRLNEGMAVLRGLPLLTDAVAMGAGAAVAEGSHSRGMIEEISEDPQLQSELRVVRVTSREIVVDDHGSFEELEPVSQMAVQALSSAAQRRLIGHGFWVNPTLLGGMAMTIPPEAVAVLSTLLSVEDRPAPQITLRTQGAVPLRLSVRTEEWEADPGAIVARLMSMRKSVDDFELREHAPR